MSGFRRDRLEQRERRGRCDRRELLRAAIGIGATAAFAACAVVRHESEDEERGKHESGAEDEIGPGEDLMREHGVLNRILLVYEEGLLRIAANAQVPWDALQDAAKLVRRFVEDYHEKIEETQLFPRFEKKGRLVDLVATLREQHAAGRRLTERIELLAAGDARNGGAALDELVKSVRSFVRMYRPHEAREDTVLFPEFHKIVTPREYDELGEQFEDEEHRVLGADGFEGAVAEVARIERVLAIDDLRKFTPG